MASIGNVDARDPQIGARLRLVWEQFEGELYDGFRADSGAGDVFDANALDSSTRTQAARGGYDRGHALAELLSELWR